MTVNVIPQCQIKCAHLSSYVHVVMSLPDKRASLTEELLHLSNVNMVYERQLHVCNDLCTHTHK